MLHHLRPVRLPAYLHRPLLCVVSLVIGASIAENSRKIPPPNGGSIPRDAVFSSFSAALLGSPAGHLVAFLVGSRASQRAADFMLAVKGNSYKGARYDGSEPRRGNNQPINQPTPFPTLLFAFVLTFSFFLCLIFSSWDMSWDMTCVLAPYRDCGWLASNFTLRVS